MQILNAKSQIKEATAVALGMFDGVHLGHREVINQATNYAQKHGMKSAIITLRNHPRYLTQGQGPKLITNLDTRLKLFEDLGVDYILVLDFDEQLMNTSAEEYLQKYLVDILNAKFISTGYDHHFGKNRSGTPDMLKAWSQKKKIELCIVDAYKKDSKLISSSEIRDLITQGCVDQAAKLLGYNFMIIGEITVGDKRGRGLGFPTANIKLPDDMVIPAKGVYCGTCLIDDAKSLFEKFPDARLASPRKRSLLSVNEHFEGERNNADGTLRTGSYSCVVNIGTRPSFSDSEEVIIETHILDFNEEIYGKTLTLNLSKRLRDERKFASAEALKEQINKDIKLCMN